MTILGNIERTEPMTREEFEAWAKEIGLSDAQVMPVWYVIGREYERGAASQRGAVDRAERAERERDEWREKYEAMRRLWSEAVDERDTAIGGQ